MRYDIVLYSLWLQLSFRCATVSFFSSANPIKYTSIGSSGDGMRECECAFEKLLPVSEDKKTHTFCHTIASINSHRARIGILYQPYLHTYLCLQITTFMSFAELEIAIAVTEMNDDIWNLIDILYFMGAYIKVKWEKWIFKKKHTHTHTISS